MRVATHRDGRLTRRELLRRGWVVGAGGTLLAAGLAACGGGGKKGSTAPTTGAEPSVPTSAPPAGSGADTAGGGTAPATVTSAVETVAVPDGPALRASIPTPQGPLDPHLAADPGAIVLAQQAGEY